MEYIKNGLVYWLPLPQTLDELKIRTVAAVAAVRWARWDIVLYDRTSVKLENALGKICAEEHYLT
jgi:hypothetical protein